MEKDEKSIRAHEAAQRLVTVGCCFHSKSGRSKRGSQVHAVDGGDGGPVRGKLDDEGVQLLSEHPWNREWRDSLAFPLVPLCSLPPSRQSQLDIS